MTAALHGPLSPVVDGMSRVFCCHKAVLSGLAPPNSLEAVRECAAAAVPRIEVDVQFLADATPIVFHDDLLDRDTDGSGPVGAADPVSARRLAYRATGAPLAFLDDVVDALRGGDTVLQVDLKPFRPLSRARIRSLVRSLRPLNDRVLLGSQAHWNLRPFAHESFRVAFDPTLHWRYRAAPAPSGRLPLRRGRHGLWDDAPLAHERGVSTRYYLESRIADIRALVPASVEWMVDVATVRFLLAQGFHLGDLLRRSGLSLAAWTIATDAGDATTAELRDLFAAGAETVITDVPLALAGRYIARTADC